MNPSSKKQSVLQFRSPLSTISTNIPPSNESTSTIISSSSLGKRKRNIIIDSEDDKEDDILYQNNKDEEEYLLNEDNKEDIRKRIELAVQPFLKDGIDPYLAVNAIMESLSPPKSNTISPTKIPLQTELVSSFNIPAGEPAIDTILLSKAGKELINICTRAVSMATLLQVTTGYKHRTSDIRTAPALTNTKKCWLAQGTKNKGGTGHVAIRPVLPASGTRVTNGTERTTRRSQQFVHRLAIRAWGSLGEIERMIKGGSQNEVSHLCDEGECYNPEHLILESHSDNEKRKHKGRACSCNPPCIII